MNSQAARLSAAAPSPLIERKSFRKDLTQGLLHGMLAMFSVAEIQQRYEIQIKFILGVDKASAVCYYKNMMEKTTR